MIYESENLIKPQRTATNRRRYSEDDIRRVRVIQFLTRQKGVNLAGVKYVLRLLQSLGNQGLDLNQVRELDTLQEVSGNGIRGGFLALSAKTLDSFCQLVNKRLNRLPG